MWRGVTLVCVLSLTACVWRTRDEASSSTPTELADPVEDAAEKADEPASVDEVVPVQLDSDAPAIWPRPFSADVIRDGLPQGTQLTFAMSGSRTGEAEVDWEIQEHGPAEVTIGYTTRLADGTVQGGNAETYPWSTLEEHASFPKAMSERSETSVTVAAGTFDATHFVVTPQGTPRPVVERFWFARSLPGPPVLHEVEEDGAVVHRMELKADSRVED